MLRFLESSPAEEQGFGGGGRLAVLGEAIHTARVAAGLTQAQLSEQAGVRQGPLSRYENDLRRPDEQTLERLAGVLGLTRRLLDKASSINGSTAVEAHMRRRATAPAKAWRRVEAQLNILRIQLHQLLRVVDFDPPNAAPVLDPMDYPPADAAALTRAQWRMTIGPVRNMTGWLESAGCLIVEWDFGASRIDGMSQWVDDYPVLAVNARMPTDRKRLTLAHELGHIVMHSAPVYLDMEVEQEAMDFAAEFLMPASVIRPELRNLTLGRLSDLKRKWMVSMAALIERAHKLGAIPPAKRTSLYKMLSAKGWRKHEPLGSRLPPERPRTPGVIVEELRRLRYTDGQIAEFGGFADAGRAAEVLPLGAGLRVLR